MVSLTTEDFMKGNFTPFTQKEIVAIMENRHTIPKQEQLYTSGGVKVYMMSFNFSQRG